MGNRGDAAFTEFETTRTKEGDGTVYKVPALVAKTTNHAPDADVFRPVSDAKGKALAVDEGTGDIEQENKSSRFQRSSVIP